MGERGEERVAGEEVAVGHCVEQAARARVAAGLAIGGEQVVEEADGRRVRQRPEDEAVHCAGDVRPAASGGVVVAERAAHGARGTWGWREGSGSTRAQYGYQPT